VTSLADKAIKNRDRVKVEFDKLSQKTIIAHKEVETLKNLIFDTQQFAREMQTEEDKLQFHYERMVKEIASLTNKIDIFVEQNAELEKPDSDMEERKEFEAKLQAVQLESQRCKQELLLLKKMNKSVRREDTDAAIATNEAVATAKKFQKLLADQQAKNVVARSTYAALKVSLHSYETKHNDCNRELSLQFKKAVQDTDTIRFSTQIESLTELLEKEQQNLHNKIEQIEELEALAEDLKFDARAIKYELTQQNGDNRRTRRDIFDLQNSIELKERLQEVLESEMEGQDEISDDY